MKITHAHVSRVLMFLGTGAVLLGGACSQQDDIATNGDVTLPPVTTQAGTTPPSATEIIASCANNPIQEDVQTVIFPAVTNQCQWGKNGNLPFPAQNNIITARGEQTVSLPLPKGALMCGIDFNFPASAKDVKLHYDDEIILAFNGYVLASSYDYSPLFQKSADLSVYDFSALAGQPYTQSDGKHPYCLGNDCVVPKTETTGVWGISIPDTLTAQLSSAAVKADKFEFMLVTTGDNDPDTDCQNTGLQFSVHRRYVIPQ